MNTPGLRAVIQQLKETNLKENAYLGFFYNDSEHDYETCYIKANKEGLELYANALLEASLEMDRRAFIGNKKEVFNLHLEGLSKSSNFEFSFIEFLEKTRVEIVEPVEEEHDQTWKDNLVGYSIFGCFITVLISMIIGIITIVAWFF